MPFENLLYLSNGQRENDHILRDGLAHCRMNEVAEDKTGLDRIVREQALAVLTAYRASHDRGAA